MTKFDPPRLRDFLVSRNYQKRERRALHARNERGPRLLTRCLQQCGLGTLLTFLFTVTRVLAMNERHADTRSVDGLPHVCFHAARLRASVGANVNHGSSVACSMELRSSPRSSMESNPATP